MKRYFIESTAADLKVVDSSADEAKINHRKSVAVVLLYSAPQEKPSDPSESSLQTPFKHQSLL